MIKRLQRKFIMITALSVIIVMAVLLAGINAANLYQTDKESDTLLHMLSDNNGQFPDSSKKKDDAQAPAAAETDAAGNNAGGAQPSDMGNGAAGDAAGAAGADPGSAADTGSGSAQNPGAAGGAAGDAAAGKDSGGGKPDMFSSPETKFRTRYFSVLIKNDGSYDINTDNIAAVTQDGALKMAESVAAGTRTDGYDGNYKFKVTQKPEGTLVVFLDCEENLRTIRNFAVLSVAVGAACLILVVVLVAALSKRAIAPAVESMEKQKRFITDAGHEIKTPLAIISANAEVIEMTNGKSEWTDSICRQVDRLGELVKSMLELSRMDEMSEPNVYARVNLSDTVHNFADSFAAVMQMKNVTCTTDIQDNVYVNGDGSRLAQLVSLLMDNAVKYCTEGGNIDVRLWITGRKANVSVYNPYDGEFPENLDKLFDRFYRTDESRSRSTGGYGIGLSVAQAIVHAHKGRISAAKKDEGIIFTVSISTK